jgi:hypothetical protein
MPQVKVGWRSGAVAAPSVSTILLDAYSGAAAAYSLRKLSSTYTGSAIRVRRSSDNTELNIGFDANGDLDTYSLSAFVGTGNGFVTTWYDQSGSYNLIQTTAANQPSIVLSGAINTQNGKPILITDFNSHMFNDSLPINGTTNSIFATIKMVTTRGNISIMSGYNLAYNPHFVSRNTNGNNRYYDSNSDITASPLPNGLNLISLHENSSGITVYENGSNLVTNFSHDLNNTTGISIFRWSVNDNSYMPNGSGFAELIVYGNSSKLSDNSAISNNINTYYSVYPNPTSVWNLLAAAYNADSIGSSSLKTSLVAAYNGESNANDSKGTNNGTAQGGLTYGTGKIGNAFQFNGSTSYVSLPTSSLQLTTFSINFWLYNPGNSSKTIAANLGNDGQNKGWYLDLTNGPTIRFVAWNNGTNIIGLNATGNPGYLNRWSMATLTVNGTSVKMYLDGSLVNSGTMSNTINYTTTTYPLIGGYRINNGAVSSILANNTRLDAFNVWQKELTQSEITELYNSGNGAQYIGDNFYKPTTNDALGTNNGTAQGGLTYGLGKVGTAFQFNGTNAYVDYGDNFDLGLSSWSYSFWTIPTSLIGERTFFSKSVAGAMDGRFFAFAYHDFFKVGMQVATIGGAPNIIEVISTNVIPTSWTMMTIVFDRSDKIKCYFNGNQIVMTTLTGTNNLSPYSAINYNTSAPFRIGAYTAFDGVTPMLFAQNKMDAFNIWNRALTQSEITELYNSGNGKQYPN